MTVGETLTEARAQAGLSVDELSERTRIRGTVIRSIEQDDYEACGGDLYVRGYVRALAGAVGIDAQPLIREYDSGRASGASGRRLDRRARQVPARRQAPPTAFDLPAVARPRRSTVRSADLGATRFDLPAVSADPRLPRTTCLRPRAEVPPTTEFPRHRPRCRHRPRRRRVPPRRRGSTCRRCPRT